MQLALSLCVIAAAVAAIVYRFEVRLTLLLAALALGSLAGDPTAIVQTFLDYFTREQFLLPIGCCMGFAHVLRHTGCDLHLVHLLVRPLHSVRVLLIPGVALVGVAVNVPVISQAGTIAAVGSVLVPVLRAAGLSPVTVGCSLALGASIGGELLNPGAPELRTVSRACNSTAIVVVHRVWPLLLVHLAVTVPLFWLLSARAERARPGKVMPDDAAPLAVNPVKALIPLVPLLLLFLTSLPPPFRLVEVPRDWLVPAGAPRELFDTRLIGAAMLVGVAAAALTDPTQAGATARVFFEGAGHALTTVTSVIVAATCFGKGVEMAGVPELLHHAIAAAPHLLLPFAVLLPAAFSWISGSGMASTQSLFGFFVAPAEAVGVDPVHVGAVVSLSAAGGRTVSPVAAVVLLSATLSGATPLAMVRRMVIPVLAGLVAVAAAAALLG